MMRILILYIDMDVLIVYHPTDCLRSYKKEDENTLLMGESRNRIKKQSNGSGNSEAESNQMKHCKE